MCNMSKTLDETDGREQRILPVNTLVALYRRREGRSSVRRRATDAGKWCEGLKTEVPSPDTDFDENLSRTHFLYFWIPDSAHLALEMKSFHSSSEPVVGTTFGKHVGSC